MATDAATGRPEVGTIGWRREHCEAGDVAIAGARRLYDTVDEICANTDAKLVELVALRLRSVAAAAAIAQAHYAAANVRYRVGHSGEQSQG